jgi:maltooligosyltrehalose trehalohydrolase
MRRGRIAIACNLGTESVRVDVTGELLLQWGDPSVEDRGTALPGHSVAVLREPVD